MASTGATYAITGASGRLGGRVARRLAASGIAQTLLARTPSRAPRLPGAIAVPGAYDDHEALVRALRATDRVLMVSAAESPDRLRDHRTFVDAAARAGVAHLVYISFYGAAPDATFTLARDHWHTEQHIRAAGIPFTFLRDNLYADFMPALVGADGAIRGPAGDGRAALVAQDDIADAAVAVLRDPRPHAGHAYELTGPEALTLTDVARILTEVGGRPVSYVPETTEEAYASRAAYGAPGWQLDAWVSTYTAIGDGSLATVTTAIEDLTGRRAASLDQVLRAAADGPASPGRP
ncbi:SDR family oxidoreductase [Streptomyces sp. NPDC021080]|uniref:SDR family oxidoreductase n=1 Tax=Streptomyces sp. NPDC021080 TaxID=3365110 RepID=UPI0037B26BFE